MPEPKRPPRKPFVFGGVHETILKDAIYPYHFLTAKQITRLLYPTEKLGNISTIQGRLSGMVQAKFLQSSFVPLPARQRPFFYTIGMQGRKYLREQGYEPDVYYEPEVLLQKSYNLLMHTLELNDFLISAKQLERTLAATLPDFTLYHWLHDFAIKKHPPIAHDTNGKTVHIEPDGFLDFRYTINKNGQQKTRRYPFIIEYDRANHSDERLRKKIHDTLLCFEQGNLTAHFAAKRLTIIYVTSAGEKRVEFMRELARQELQALDKTITVSSYRNMMFKFGSVPPLMQPPLDPYTLFCTPLWLSPIGSQKTALIDLTQ